MRDTKFKNLKKTRNSSLLTCSHHMVLLKSENKNTDFLTISACLCRVHALFASDLHNSVASLLNDGEPDRILRSSENGSLLYPRYVSTTFYHVL